MLQKTLVLIPELLHFTAAVRWLSYHPHLASHRIALHCIIPDLTAAEGEVSQTETEGHGRRR
jgi:hypothetical protein